LPEVTSARRSCQPATALTTDGAMARHRTPLTAP